MGGLSFNLVPVNIRVPGQYIEIDNSNAFQGLPGMPVKALVVGQMTGDGTGTPLTPYQILTIDQSDELFGPGSQLAGMMRAFKAADPEGTVNVWAVAQVDNGAGAAAVGHFLFGGAATVAGTLNAYIGGELVQIAVATTDTPANVATNFAAAVNALPTLPVSAAVDGVTPAKVNLTANNKGVQANYLDLRINYHQDEFTPDGLTVVITAMAAGAANPDVTAVFAAIGADWYTDFAVAYTDDANVAAVEAALLERFGPLDQADGNAYFAKSDTHANLITAGEARNSPFSCIVGANKSPTPQYKWAAAIAAVTAFYSLQDPARPLQTVALAGILAPAIGDQFTWEERNLLLYGGIGTFKVDSDGTVRIERLITTYQENPAGAPDPSYLDIETLKTLAYLRFDVRTFIALRYPRYKLADDGTPIARGQAIVTPNVIRASLIGRFQQWEDAGLVEDIDQFKADLIVQRNQGDVNRIDALLPPNIINQLRVFAGLLQFVL